MISPKFPDQFKTPSGLVKAKAWTDYLFGAIRRETGAKWKPIDSEVGVWSRVLKNRISSGLDPFVLALMIDIIALEENWDSLQELSPWQMTTHENIFRFFTNRKAWFWRAVWFSRYAKGETETSLYIDYLVKAEVAHSVHDDGKSLEICVTILDEFERKVIERRGNELPPFDLHWIKEKYSEWNN